jgi:hypothetical protein
MNYQLANLSTDLRRISNWILEGKRDFVREYITKIEDKYDIDVPIGPYKDIWKEIKLIKLGKGGRINSADRAGTLSSILLQESLKQ